MSNNKTCLTIKSTVLLNMKPWAMENNLPTAQNSQNFHSLEVTLQLQLLCQLPESNKREKRNKYLTSK